MELWVRSQRKICLMKINKIRINKGEKWQVESFNEDNYTTIILGEYKSKERALEILDEIQNTIIGFENENNYVSTQCYAIYEMPEE